MNPTCIELFAGGGGLSIGLENANVNTIIHLEYNKDCCATLRKNRPHWNVVEKDIREQKWENHHVDIVTGGFPCQAFSHSGKRLGFEDTRGTLFYEFARCVKETNPMIFMAENVKGLITHEKGKTFEIILNVFSDLGYNIDWKILNANDYDVPQKRERVFIIGIRNDLDIKFDWPIKSNNKPNLQYVFENVFNDKGLKYSSKKEEIMKLIPEGGNWKNLPIDKQIEYMGKAYYAEGGKTGIAKRLNRFSYSPTIMCSPCQKQTERCHPIETRPINILESARIQTFPDDWEFCGKISSQYMQIGNAIPVKLGEHLAIKLFEFVNKYNQERK